MKSLIFCSDCELRSVATFHFVYHKCQMCGGFNTRVLKTFDSINDSPPSEEQEEEAILENHHESFMARFFSRRNMLLSCSILLISSAGYYCKRIQEDVDPTNYPALLDSLGSRFFNPLPSSPPSGFPYEDPFLHYWHLFQQFLSNLIKSISGTLGLIIN
eukprot:Sdes_comp22609_c0_seq1m21035